MQLLCVEGSRSMMPSEPDGPASPGAHRAQELSTHNALPQAAKCRLRIPPTPEAPGISSPLTRQAHPAVNSPDYMERPPLCSDRRLLRPSRFRTTVG